MAQAQYHRPGTLWYVSDGFIWDDQPANYRSDPNRPFECSSKLFVFNPQSGPANVVATFYHTQREPTHVRFTVAPGAIRQLELAGLLEVPHRQFFWVVIESDIPVLPQARHEDFTGWDPVPDALCAVQPYPGPLTDETHWTFPDCYVSAPFDVSRSSWYEVETLTLLNPHAADVAARVRYLPRGRDFAAELEVNVPARRLVALHTTDLAPTVAGTQTTARIFSDYAVRVDASSPVIAQMTRRARWVGRADIIGSRSIIGMPVRAPGHTLWHYPGGSLIERHVLPVSPTKGQNIYNETDQCWNLVFIQNLSDQASEARVTFHHPDGSAHDIAPLAVPAMKSRLEPLHAPPYQGTHALIDQPWGFSVEAGIPVACEVCGCEFEMWSQVIPGAMSAVPLYPGPLHDETTWWLGIGHAGGDDAHNVEWDQTFHFLNPTSQAVNVSLSFLGSGEAAPPPQRLTLLPGAAAWVNTRDVPGLQMDRPFAVRADGDAPFCAQVYVRTFTRGVPQVRAMYSNLGTPMQLRLNA